MRKKYFVPKLHLLHKRLSAGDCNIGSGECISGTTATEGICQEHGTTASLSCLSNGSTAGDACNATGGNRA
jgi:hypothetical protein